MKKIYVLLIATLLSLSVVFAGIANTGDNSNMTPSYYNSKYNDPNKQTPPNLDIGSQSSAGFNTTVTFCGVRNGEPYGYRAHCEKSWTVDPCNWQSTCNDSQGWTNGEEISGCVPNCKNYKPTQTQIISKDEGLKIETHGCGAYKEKECLAHSNTCKTVYERPWWGIGLYKSFKQCENIKPTSTISNPSNPDNLAIGKNEIKTVNLNNESFTIQIINITTNNAQIIVNNRVSKTLAINGTSLNYNNVQFSLIATQVSNRPDVKSWAEINIKSEIEENTKVETKNEQTTNNKQISNITCIIPICNGYKPKFLNSFTEQGCPIFKC